MGYKITFLLVICIGFCKISPAQEKTEIKAVINFVTDVLISHKNINSPPLEKSSKSLPSILSAWTVEINLEHYDKYSAYLTENNQNLDTSGIYSKAKNGAPIDISTIMPCKYNLILSNYLSNDSDFVKHLKDLIIWKTISTPIFFNQTKNCLIQVTETFGSTTYLLGKEGDQWAVIRVLDMSGT